MGMVVLALLVAMIGFQVVAADCEGDPPPPPPPPLSAIVGLVTFYLLW